MASIIDMKKALELLQAAKDAGDVLETTRQADDQSDDQLAQAQAQLAASTAQKTLTVAAEQQAYQGVRAALANLEALINPPTADAPAGS